MFAVGWPQRAIASAAAIRTNPRARANQRERMAAVMKAAVVGSGQLAQQPAGKRKQPFMGRSSPTGGGTDGGGGDGDGGRLWRHPRHCSNANHPKKKTLNRGRDFLPDRNVAANQISSAPRDSPDAGIGPTSAKKFFLQLDRDRTGNSRPDFGRGDHNTLGHGIFSQRPLGRSVGRFGEKLRNAMAKVGGGGGGGGGNDDSDGGDSDGGWW